MALQLTCFSKHSNILKCTHMFHKNTKHFQLKCLETPSSSGDSRQNTWSNQDYMKFVKNAHIVNHDKKKNKDEYGRKMLEEEVRMSIIQGESESSLKILELIDDIERLGVGFWFDKEIREALNKINTGLMKEESLHATALRFRLLRKHGYHVSQDMFISFKDDEGSFKNSLKEDVNGMLSLYEASYLAFEGETLLEEAKSFTISHLKHSNLKIADHAIEMPLHHRMLRLEARWYIDVYSLKKDANQSLLQFAILDFNMVQSVFQDDLLESLRWWEHTRLAVNLSFIRDRLVECFFWTVGIVFEPQYSLCRKVLTKVISLITSMDDVYDVYGTLDQLQLFTDAVKRWDVRVTDTLPDEMKLCFLVLYDLLNELADDDLQLRGINTITILTKVWGDLFEGFLVEAKWNKSKHTPTLEEYLENACLSVSGVVILVHAYLLMGENIANNRIDFLESDFSDLLKWPSLIFRLCNDLATSMDEMKRGETANAILCYMKESGASEEEAREHIKGLIDEAWQKMNKYLVSDTTSKAFIQAVINLARISQCIYQFGDGHGAPSERSNNRVKSLIAEPITINGQKNI